MAKSRNATERVSGVRINPNGPTAALPAEVVDRSVPNRAHSSASRSEWEAAT